MNELEDEKLIRNLFATLPRRPFSQAAGRKQEVWQKVQNYIRAERLQSQRERNLSLWRRIFLPRTVLRAAMVILVVIMPLSLVGGVAYAQPGQTLYPVKIAAEQVELVLATNDEAKVKVGIKHAKRRLAEVQTLVQGNKDSKIVQDTLNAMKSTTDTLVKVAATAETKPELVTQAASLAAEQEEILSNVGNSSENLAVKDAVHNAITAAKESRTKLGGDEVKGVATTELPVAPAPSTTPPTLATPGPVIVKPPKKDANLGATIQIDEVITIGDDNKTTSVGQ